MNILLLDDEPSALARTGKLLAAKATEVQSFSAGEALLRFHRENRAFADTVVLDILLNGQDMDGVQVARQLRKEQFAGPIVFLTSSNEYASESYEVKASGYLLKPVDEAKVEDAFAGMQAALDEWRAKDAAAITVTTGSDYHRLFFRDLMYMEVTRNTLHFHMVDGHTVSVRGTMKAYAPGLLSDKRFVQSHASFVVNLDYALSLSSGDIHLCGGVRIPISKAYSGTKEQFVRYRTGV
jgi:DNA-binding LytR/AlgR family response regulator